jgi:hypothetical protein
VAVGDGGTVQTSSDGFFWPLQIPPVSGNLLAVNWGFNPSEIFVAAGDDGNIILSPGASDGSCTKSTILTSPGETPPTNRLYDVCHTFSNSPMVQAPQQVLL